MKYIILLFLFVSHINFGQEGDSKSFPEDYLGNYKGNLHIENKNGEQDVAMEFHLKATESDSIFKYTLVYYINNKPSPREYTLIVKDKAKGLYKIDENNGILLDAKLINNSLMSIFEVQGNLLITTERFFEDYMLFEIVFTPKAEAKTTTATTEAIDVVSYPITTTQTAKLTKVKN